jgi:hypothetical protein
MKFTLEGRDEGGAITFVRVVHGEFDERKDAWDLPFQISPEQAQRTFEILAYMGSVATARLRVSDMLGGRDAMPSNTVWVHVDFELRPQMFPIEGRVRREKTV